MNIKTKLILAATAVSLLSTPAFAFRDMGDSGGDSAFAIPEAHSAGNTHYGPYGTYGAYASGRIVRPRHFVQPRHRLGSRAHTRRNSG
jgi:hypothetical protein